MTQKTNLNGLNVSFLKDWNSVWYLSSIEYSKILNEDLLLYRLLRSLKLYKNYNQDIKIFDITKMRVCRVSNGIIVKIYYSFDFRLKYNQYTSLWINKWVQWKKANLIELTSKVIYSIGNLFSNKHNVYINFYKMSLSSLKIDVNFVSKKIASLIENRIKFRSRLIKTIIIATKELSHGIFVSCSGRLNGVDIARNDSISYGSIPFQSIDKNVTYGYSIANTTKGLQSVKVFINV
jgi:ribosomal protein S3